MQGTVQLWLHPEATFLFLDTASSLLAFYHYLFIYSFSHPFIYLLFLTD